MDNIFDTQQVVTQFAEALARLSTISMSYYLSLRGYEELMKDDELVAQALKDPEIEAKRSELIQIIKEVTDPAEFKQRIFELTTEVGKMAGDKVIDIMQRKAC